METTENEVKELVKAAQSVLSALLYVEKEMTDLNAVLPEFNPARRCVFVLDGEPEKLRAALKPFVLAKEPSEMGHRAVGYISPVEA